MPAVLDTKPRSTIDELAEALKLAEIPRISHESGITICVGCGWYVEELHPPEIGGLSVEELAVMLLAELRDLGEVFQELARSDVKPGDLLDYVAAAYGQTPEDAAKGRRLAPITELFESGTGQDLPGARGTVWGLYNALTEFVTHQAGRGSDSDANARRHFGSVMGDGARVLARGLDAALVLARKSYTLESVFGDHAQIVTDATAAHPDALILPARQA